MAAKIEIAVCLVILALIFVLVVAWPAMRYDYKNGNRLMPTLVGVGCVVLVAIAAILGMTA
jgi:mannose/fructose/N-acetylgalactosamine-specific phosphotransferase system component IID